MFTSAGTSLATVAGVPVGVMLSELLDWRSVFGVAALATAVLAAALRALLPSVPAESAARLSLLVDTVRRPAIGLGLAGHILVVLGHFLAYTYIRLALDRVAGADAATVILLLALFGIGGFLGNIVIGLVIDRTYRAFAVISPLVIAVMVALVIAGSGSVWAIGAFVFVWGFFFASWLLIANTWVGHRLPDRLEAGGSILVVGFQAAIMVAAGAGGMLVDGFGVVTVYLAGAVALVIGAVLFGLSNRSAAAVSR